jgi:hypothetical protein
VKDLTTGRTELVSGGNFYRTLRNAGLSDDHFQQYAERIDRFDFPTPEEAEKEKLRRAEFEELLASGKVQQAGEYRIKRAEPPSVFESYDRLVAERKAETERFADFKEVQARQKAELERNGVEPEFYPIYEQVVAEREAAQVN